MTRDIQVQLFEQLHGSRAMPMAVEAWHALLTAGHIGNSTAVQWNDLALVASAQGEQAGILTFRADANTGFLDVVMGYVRPAHRGTGVLSALGAALMREARERGRENITWSVSSSNEPMHRLARALGGKPAGTNYRLPVGQVTA